jgi:cardiolipin synthase
MWRHLPNALCVLRILLIVPIAWALLHGAALTALVVFALAAFTDAVDGFLAKRFHWESELGKRLDPLADKLLLVTVFVVIALLDWVPFWLAAAVVLRDLLITVGGLTYLCLYGDPKGHPTFISKTNTLLQVVLVFWVVGAAAGIRLLAEPAAVPFLATLGALTFSTTVVSGLDYVLTYSRKARAAHHAQRRGTTTSSVPPAVTGG